MALIFCKLPKQKKLELNLLQALKNSKKNLQSQIARKWIFLRANKVEKTIPTFLLST